MSYGHLKPSSHVAERTSPNRTIGGKSKAGLEQLKQDGSRASPLAGDEYCTSYRGSQASSADGPVGHKSRAAAADHDPRRRQGSRRKRHVFATLRKLLEPSRASFDKLRTCFHTLALDGMYVPGDTSDAEPQFVPAPEPTAAQVHWLCERVAIRARRLIARRPWNEPDQERVLPVFKVFGAEPKEPGPKRLHARVDGWDLHAATAFHADERIAVERFCRYAMRGPIANGRLTRGPRDKLTYRLKTAKPDGTTELVLSPMALLERLARLIPQPGRHLTRYFGVLSSGAAWRPLIVPKPMDEEGAPFQRRRGRRLDWANLLRRVFLAEILACACGGTRRVIAAIEEGPAARKILRHLGLPHEPPRLAPARLDQSDFWPTGPPAEDFCDPPYVDDVQSSPPRSW